jgi:hypothetical protein
MKVKPLLVYLLMILTIGISVVLLFDALIKIAGVLFLSV